VRAEKGIVQHIDASSVVWTLIDNGILHVANQIAKLAAIVIKHITLAIADSNRQ